MMVKYAITIVIAIAALGFLSVIDVSAWDPDECSDEYREIPGNRQSPCQLVLPELTEVEYRVRLDYPDCFEEIVFHMPGMTPALLEVLRRTTSSEEEGTKVGDRWDHEAIASGSHFGESYSWESDITYNGWNTNYGRVVGDDYVSWGKRWALGAPITGNSVFRQVAGRPLTVLLIYVHGKNFSVYRVKSNPAPHPDTGAMVELVNSCFDLVLQEKEDREHAAQIKRQEEETQARIAAQKDADIKAELQAQREAESQALLAKQELQATLESKARIAKTELLKTETLVTRMEHEEVIADILRDIVRIRLAGEEDRARLTNEYLSRSESASGAFEAETKEAEVLIQQYIDFNGQLLGRIEEYQAAIDSRLETVRIRMAEQQAEIAKMEMDAKAVAIELEETQKGQ